MYLLFENDVIGERPLASQVPGEMPENARNSCAKCARSEYPPASATSAQSTGRTPGEFPHDLLKPMQPAIQLRCQPDLLAEQAAPAQTGIASHIQHVPDVRRMLKFPQRILDSRMQFDPILRTIQQRRSQRAKLLGRGDRAPQPIAQTHRRPAPNQIDAKNHAHHALKPRRFDHAVPGSHAKHERRRAQFRQIENQLELSVRQHAFRAMRYGYPSQYPNYSTQVASGCAGRCARSVRCST